TRDETTEEYKRAHDRALSLPAYKIMLILLMQEVNDREFMQTWDGTYKERDARFAQRFYYILERWDWNTQEEEMKLLNGTADYYVNKEEKDESDN
ncbi:MAG: hypothetical protein J6W63_06160, partial [Treponema sp.]|nr:hypothetical protein [Treponema sp.]